MKKKTIQKYIMIVLFQLFAITGFSQMMAPNDPGGGPQGGDPPIGGGSAPVGSGIFILMSLGVAYGGKKVFHLVSQNKQKEE